MPTKNRAVPHQGEALKKAVKESGVQVYVFAEKMKVSKGALYYWFRLKELPLRTMVHAAQLLHIPVSQISGTTENTTGDFEKDVIDSLEEIKLLLMKLLQKNALS